MNRQAASYGKVSRRTSRYTTAVGASFARVEIDADTSITTEIDPATKGFPNYLGIT